MSEEVAASVPAMIRHSRRAHPRVEVMGQLYGQPETGRAPLSVRNISAGGFAIESPVAYQLGSQHLFRFTTIGNEVVFLNARAIHAHRVDHEAGPPFFVVGFSFVHDGTFAERAINRLLEAVTAALQIEEPADAELPEV